MVPSSSADITRALHGFFRGQSVCVVLFRFKVKENLQSYRDLFFDILISSKGALTLGMFEYISRNLNRSLNQRRMSPAQTITTEWATCLEKRVQSKQTPKHKLGNQTNSCRWSNVQAGARCPSSKMQFKQQRQQRQRQRRLKKRVDIQPKNLARILNHSVCLYYQKYRKQNI